MRKMRKADQIKTAIRRLLTGKRVPVLVILLAVSLILFAKALYRTEENRITQLSRPSESSAEGMQRITVIRENGQKVPLNIRVSSRLISEAEAGERFSQAAKLLPDRIRGSNLSLEQVQSDLELPDSVDELGIRLVWESGAPEYMDHMGCLKEGRRQAEPREVTLTVTMTLQAYSSRETFSVRILPEPAPDWEERLSEELERQEAGARAEQEFVLPEIFEGERLSFVQPKDRSKQIRLALLPAIAGLLIAAEKGQTGEREKQKRREKIAEDYPEFVVKMTVLYQAGLSMRSVWERIGSDEKRKGDKLRPLYEEVCFACNSMADGVSEPEAYRQFGQRCCTDSCLKLGNLLAGNVRRGTAHLSAMMAEESERAWELRKHRARRNGEKAGTKMLVPMFMMFGVILAMVVIPAFYSFMI